MNLLLSFNSYLLKAFANIQKPGHTGKCWALFLNGCVNAGGKHQVNYFERVKGLSSQ